MDTGIFIGDKVITTSWDKIWNKPTTLSGYGITDAYTQSDADGRFFRYFGYTADSGDDFTWWQKLGTLAYLNAFPDGVTIKRHISESLLILTPFQINKDFLVTLISYYL